MPSVIESLLLKVLDEYSLLMIAVQVLMDITDVIGDREAGVRTIPVVAGQTIHSTHNC